MTHRTIDISEAAPTNRFDQTIDWLLACTLAFMPLALGVVEPWSETVTIAAVAALAFCLVLRQTRRDAGLVWTWAYVPMLLFIAVAILQVVPLPSNWVAAISPQTLSVKTKLLADAAPPDKLTFSFYPRATRHDLEVVLLAAAVFVTVLHVYRTADQVKRLLTVIAIIGGAVGLLALLEYLTGADKIYWSIPMPENRRPSGPFVHYSHYAQFMNLSMGAAMGLFLVKARQTHPYRKLRLGRVFRNFRDREYRFAWWLCAVLAVGILTVSISMSRGGVLAMVAALGVTLVSLSRRQGLGGKQWLAGAAIFLACIGVLYFASEKVSDRLATLYNMHDPTQGRAQIYKDVWQESFPRFPIAGMGLGTFEVTYPMFDRGTISALAAYADADWVQLLHEMGIVGMLLVLLFVGVIVFNYFRATRSNRPTICTAAFGLGFGLLAVIINSFSDYGQHLPSIACLSAISCALMINLGRWKRPEETAADEFRTRRAPLPLRVALPAGLLAGLCWLLPQANAARLADQQWQQVEVASSRLEQQGWAGTDEDYAGLVNLAQTAVNLDPGDIDHRYWLAVYHWEAIDHPEPPKDPDQPDDAVTQPATQPVVVPAVDVSKLTMLDPTPDTQPAAPMTQPATQPASPVEPTPSPVKQLPKDKYPEARRIVAELLETRRLCPTYGPLYSVAGQIRFFALHEPSGAAEVELGYNLTKDHPITCYAAALVEGTRGNWDACREHFRRCLELENGRMIPEMVNVCLYRLDRPDMPLEVTQNRLDWYCHVCTCLVDDGRHEQLSDAACAQAVGRLKSQGLPEKLESQASSERGVAAAYSTAGVVCQDRGEFGMAAGYYRKALALDYGNALCRCRLAECYLAMHRTNDAVHEARICLRFDPTMGTAKRIITGVAEGPGRPDAD